MSKVRPCADGGAPDATSRSAPRALRVYLMSIGSRGDHQPALVLGRTLRRRGHHVTVHGDAPHEAWFLAAPAAADVFDASPWDVERTFGAAEGLAALRKGDNNRILASLKGMYDDVLLEQRWFAWARDRIVAADPDVFVAVGPVPIKVGAHDCIAASLCFLLSSRLPTPRR